MTGWNLPPGCTQADIDRAFGGEDECDHEEYETDVGMGRAECQICGHRWWMTKEEIDAECERIASYETWARQEHRHEKLIEWWRWIVGLVKKSPEVDDEIPF